MPNTVRFGLGLAAAALLAGCDDTAAPDPLAKLYRANQELQRQTEAQTRVIATMGGILILLGGSLAISLGAHLRKGGRPRATTTAKTAAD